MASLAPGEHRPEPLLWSVIVPVKRTEIAKSRLGVDDPGLRAELALAFAADTVAAAAACPAVTQVLVVTDDPAVAGLVEPLGAVVVPDAPDAGLNPALVHGAEEARARRPGAPLAALQSDLPALRPAVLAEALEAAASYETAFVADAHGTGTVLYAVNAEVVFAPRFGPRSRAAHRAAGAVELEAPGLSRLRRDVDTQVDLWDARRLGVGPHTAAALDRAS